MVCYDVVIVGAGPVGLLAALILVNKGCKVIVIERQARIEESPRAIVYLPTTLPTLTEAGIEKEAIATGLIINEGPSWRRPNTGEALARMELMPPPPGAPPLISFFLGQHLLAEIAQRRLFEKNTEVRFNVKFTHVTQLESGLKVRAIDENTGIVIDLDTSFVLGADGAHSSVRTSLGLPFEGFTHDVAFMAVNFRYSKIDATGFRNAQFIVDPQEKAADSNFAVILQTGKSDVWRCAYGDASDFTDEELIARLPGKLKAILPLNPDPEEVEVLKAQPYRIHQRCVPNYVSGRVLLAGDAAHINNPVGGLGLNCGISDAHVAALSITAALKESDEEKVSAILEDYSKQRRSAFVDYVNPTSINNLRRLRDPSSYAQDMLREEFFAMMNGDLEENMKTTASAVRIAQGVPGFPRA